MVIGSATHPRPSQTYNNVNGALVGFDMPPAFMVDNSRTRDVVPPALATSDSGFRILIKRHRQFALRPHPCRYCTQVMHHVPLATNGIPFITQRRGCAYFEMPGGGLLLSDTQRTIGISACRGYILISTPTSVVEAPGFFIQRPQGPACWLKPDAVPAQVNQVPESMRIIQRLRKPPKSNRGQRLHRSHSLFHG